MRQGKTRGQGRAGQGRAGQGRAGQLFHLRNRPYYHSVHVDALLEFDQTQNIKHANEKNNSNNKLVSGPIVRVIHQSIAKCHHLGNFHFYKVLSDEWVSLAHLPYRTLQKENTPLERANQN